mmetsp:Transcript_11849/g.31978  ORF Transcript_11849/g.31978 Transcript_11849/m.31978 type:complete len:240 (-) Transcript_11849:322-1041(-)
MSATNDQFSGGMAPGCETSSKGRQHCSGSVRCWKSVVRKAYCSSLSELTPSLRTLHALPAKSSIHPLTKSCTKASSGVSAFVFPYLAPMWDLSNAVWRCLEALFWYASGKPEITIASHKPFWMRSSSLNLATASSTVFWTTGLSVRHMNLVLCPWKVPMTAWKSGSVKFASLNQGFSEHAAEMVYKQVSTNSSMIACPLATVHLLVKRSSSPPQYFAAALPMYPHTFHAISSSVHSGSM